MGLIRLDLGWIAFLAVCLCGTCSGDLGARNEILKGLSKFYFSWDTQSIFVLKSNAEAIAWTSVSKTPFATASQIGQGRVIIFASWNFFIDQKTDSRYNDVYKRFTKWVSKGAASTTHELNGVRSRLATASGTYHIWTHGSPYTPTEILQLIEAIKQGRINLIISIPNMKAETEYLRPLLREGGVHIPTNVEYTSDSNVELSVQDLLQCPIDSVQTAFPKLATAQSSYFLCNAGHVFAAISKVPWTDLQECGVSQSEGLRIVNNRRGESEKFAPSEKSPMKSSTEKQWALIYNHMYLSNKLFHQSNMKAPKVKEYPGDVDSGELKYVKVEITVDARVVDEIHSIGYYLPAGSTATIEVLSGNEDNAKGWSILIGCWTDTPMVREEWTRYPIIHQRFPLQSQKIFSAFGGSIQIQNDENTRGRVKLILSGVIESPYFNLRDPKSIADWSSRVKRSSSAPWSDLVGDMISFCVPTSIVKSKSSSELEFLLRNVWDNVVKTQFEFVGEDWKIKRRERVVLDILPSYGYAHAGYPIVAWQDNEWIQTVVDRQYVFQSGAWGMCHELGHNRQNHGFTWSATVETTNNIFSLMNRDLIFHLPSFENNTFAWDEVRMKEITQHIRNGAPYSKWSTDAWLALGFYDQLAKHFGWGTLSQWMHTYTQSMKDKKPEKDQDVIDEWADRMVTITEMNLMPLYDFWNIPVSTSVGNKARKYPCFLPLDWMTKLDNKSRFNVIDKKYGGKCERVPKNTLHYVKQADLKVYHPLDIVAVTTRS